MSDQNESGIQCTTRAARYVRFTPEEFQQIVEDETRTDKSAQELLKGAYFGKGRVVILMTDDDRDRLMTQISRIGNNVNQIAKRINSGFAYGFNQEVENVRSLLTALKVWLTTKYGSYRV